MSDEWLLTLGALVLLGVFIVASNTFVLNNNTVIYENEHIITAVSLGQSLIEEAQAKFFDVQQKPPDASSLTPVGSLGRESDDLISLPDKFYPEFNCFASDTNFNDVDDYNNYQRIVEVPNLGTFVVSSTVGYVDELNPGDVNTPVSLVQTFCKRMTVRVWNRGYSYIDSVQNPVRLDYIFSPASR